jgi:hypothetical protein
MDAHFSEYLAAIAGMQELYGACPAETTEFHDASGEPATAPLVLVEA